MDQAACILTASAAFLAAFVLLLRVLVHFPIIDETTHARYLWLISEGLKPGPDFFCAYPPLFYLAMAPFFKLFPEAAQVLFFLRLVSVTLVVLAGALYYRHGRRTTGDGAAALIPMVLIASSTNIGPFLVEFSIDHAAAVAAVAAMALFFQSPTFRSLAMAAALCLLSVGITPKYAFGLFFGLVGSAAAAYLESRKAMRTAAAVVLGGAVASIAVLALHNVYGISLLANVKTAITTNARLSMSEGHFDMSLGRKVLWHFLQHPVFGVMILLGIAGWAKRSWRRLDSIALAGAGVLLGTILFGTRMLPWFEQYQAVVYLSLAVFAPFAFTWTRHTLAMKAARFLVAAAVVATAAAQFPSVAKEFDSTSMTHRDGKNALGIMGPPAFASLMATEYLLRTIPRDERVVAVWFHHPLFRRDLTPVTTDDRPSLSTFLAEDDPVRKIFDPVYFRAELEKHPPALVDLLQLGQNYPPGWAEVAQEFLMRMEGLYVPVESPIFPGEFFFIRKDLFEKDSPGQ